MKNVSYFVSVSEAWAQDLSRRHNKPAACIYNGFDEDNYELPVTLTEKFTVTFTGGLYWGKRDPSVLFAAVKELKDMGVVNARNFEVRFYGDDCLQLKAKVDLLGLGDVVSIEGGIAHQEAILRQRESTVLLQLNWDDARDKGWYTGKMCEYLGARRPILSLHTLGGTLEEKFLKASGAGVVCMSALEIKDVLLKWIGIFRDKGSLDWDVDEKWIKPFKFKEQARQYADVFDLVVS